MAGGVAGRKSLIVPNAVRLANSSLITGRWASRGKLSLIVQLPMAPWLVERCRLQLDHVTREKKARPPSGD